MVLFINQHRTYYPKFTQSELYLYQEGIGKFCYVLEDVASVNGVKIAGSTCIPEGTYDVSIKFSNRFQKDMLLLSNKPDLSVERNGLRFTGILVHGGNTVANTDGCLLTAYCTDNNGRVWQRASDDLLLWVKRQIQRGNTVKWVISS